MKIAFIVPSLANKGPIVVVDNIVKNIFGKVEQIDVFYFDDKFGVNFVCPTYKINFNTPIDFDNYDIIHSHMYRPDKYVVKWKSRIKKAKLVSTIHQDIFQNLKFSYNILVAFVFEYRWKVLLNKMDAVAVISNKLSSLYSPCFTNLKLVYNGVNIEYNPMNVNFEIVDKINRLHDNGFKIVGTYAAITKRKGLDQLVDLLSYRNDIGLVIIGEGKEKDRLVKQVEQRGLSNRILFFPYLDRPYNYLDNIDVYAMPSRSEGFGLALVEAALARTPIVCSDIDVFQEIFDDDEVCFFKIENVKSLSCAIDRALNMPDELVNNAFSKVNGKFTGLIMAENYYALYDSILE